MHTHQMEVCANNVKDNSHIIKECMTDSAETMSAVLAAVKEQTKVMKQLGEHIIGLRKDNQKAYKNLYVPTRRHWAARPTARSTSSMSSKRTATTMTEGAGEAKKSKTVETEPITESEAPVVVSAEEPQAAKPETDDFLKDDDDKKSASTVAITESGEEEEKESSSTQEIFSAIPFN